MDIDSSAAGRDGLDGGGGEEDDLSDDGKVFCLCREPDDGRVMVQCDRCQEWYHHDCVDITPYVARLRPRLRCAALLAAGHCERADVPSVCAFADFLCACVCVCC